MGQALLLDEPRQQIGRSRALNVAIATFYDMRSDHRFAEKRIYRIRALEHEFGPLEYLGPLRHGLYGPVLEGQRLLCRALRHKRFFPRRDRRLIESFGKQLSRRLARSKSNVVLSPESPGSQPVAYVDCEQPIVIWSDATFAGTMETHPNFARESLCEQSARDGCANERAALERCRLLIYMSEWAAQGAIRYYNIDAGKVRVVPGGANLDSGLAPSEVDAVVARRPSNCCRLLFIGRDWRQKGGEIALEVSKRLNRGGLPSTLTLVGAQPTSRPLPSFVTVVGRLRKSVAQDLAELKRLLREAHFLLVPTRAEAFGLVFCEASAFALPSLTTAVGGVPTAVMDGRNGKLFPLEAGADAYCSFIEDLFCNYAQYRELARSSFDEYATRLNWRSAAASVKRHMLELL
jgi:glycosyltransferase involved in cell wall biosynthesis